MSKVNLCVPKVRFRGFGDGWSSKTIDDILIVNSGRDYKHLEKGSIPVYGTGGYMLSVNQFLSETKDAVGIGRKGTINKPMYLVAPFWTVDTLFFATAQEKTEIRFAFYLLNTINWLKYDESTGVPSLSKRTIEAIQVKLPNQQEQTQIGSFFQKIDHVIELQQKALASAQDYKKAMLQKMFPQQGEKIPQIRFSGFSGDWEEKKLKDIVILLKDGTHASHSDGAGAYLLSAKNIKNKKVVLDENKDRQISIDNYELIYKNYSLKINDILFTIVGTIGESALYQGSKNKIAFQRSVAIIRSNEHIDPMFLLCSMETNSILRQLTRSASTSAQSGVYLNDLANLILFVSKKEEQQKIGTFFQKLDTQIEQHEKKLATYQNLKKAMLQRMFV